MKIFTYHIIALIHLDTLDQYQPHDYPPLLAIITSCHYRLLKLANILGMQLFK